jgi:hypothetical protein
MTKVEREEKIMLAMAMAQVLAQALGNTDSAGKMNIKLVKQHIEALGGPSPKVQAILNKLITGEL